MKRERKARVWIEVDGEILVDSVTLRLPYDCRQVEVIAAGKRYSLSTKRRFCNRCNKLLSDIAHEPRCRLLGIRVETLEMWRSRGRTDLRWLRVGRLVRYRLVDVEDFIRQNTCDADAAH